MWVCREPNLHVPSPYLWKPRRNGRCFFVFCQKITQITLSQLARNREFVRITIAATTPLRNRLTTTPFHRVQGASIGIFPFRPAISKAAQDCDCRGTRRGKDVVIRETIHIILNNQATGLYKRLTKMLHPSTFCRIGLFEICG
jgi:hypothetical protein